MSQEQRLAELFVEMINTHDPNLVDRFVAEDYLNHNAVVADGREANRRFWAMMQVFQQIGALPALGGTAAQA